MKNTMMARPPLSAAELAAIKSKRSKPTSSPLATDPTSSLVNKINELHAEANQFVITAEDAAYAAVQSAFQAGSALLELKGLVAHGKWTTTLKNNCPEISQRTANRYMKLARDYKDRPDQLPKLPLREAYLLPSPGEQRHKAENSKAQKSTGKKNTTKSGGALQKLIHLNSTIDREEFQSDLAAITSDQKKTLIKTLTSLLKILKSIEK